MKVEVSPQQALRWLPYIGGLASFHLLLLLTLSGVLGEIAPDVPVYAEVLIALPLIYGAQVAVSRYARSAWMRGYATGHWDGLEDGAQGLDY